MSSRSAIVTGRLSLESKLGALACRISACSGFALLPTCLFETGMRPHGPLDLIVRRTALYLLFVCKIRRLRSATRSLLVLPGRPHVGSPGVLT